MTAVKWRKDVKEFGSAVSGSALCTVFISILILFSRVTTECKKYAKYYSLSVLSISQCVTEARPDYALMRAMRLAGCITRLNLGEVDLG